jgi:hypothetical protein
MSTVKRAIAHREAVDVKLVYLDADWPASRGTTAQQLAAMHLEAEGES